MTICENEAIKMESHKKNMCGENEEKYKIVLSDTHKKIQSNLRV